MKEVKHIKNYNLNVLSWEDVISNLDESFKQNLFVKQKLPAFFSGHDAHKIDKLKPILQDLNLLVAHSYIQLTSLGPTYGKHQDPVDVWFWQCQGITEWVIEDRDSYILNPGDLIYVPTGISHNVIPHGPRVGVSMSKE